MSKLRDKKAARLIRIITDSMLSHLPDFDNKWKDESFERDRRFHRKTVREYIECLKIIDELW